MSLIGCITENGVAYITKLEDFRDVMGDNVFKSLEEYLNQECLKYQDKIDDLESELYSLQEEYDSLENECDDLDNRCDELEEKCNKLQSFYDYMKELYGTGLEVANWHLNGDLEPFDSFFESAEESEQKQQLI